MPGVLLLTARLLPLPRDGTLAGWPSMCPFRTLSGWPCPGCGLTRSLVLCAHGDWAQAFVFHPLGIVFYFGLWLALALGVLPLLGRSIVVSQRALIFFATTAITALLIVWIVRLTGLLPYPAHF